MKKSDLSQIKLGSAAFTSKWWKDRRPIIVHGCGVAKALDRWQRDCPKDPETIMAEPDQYSARKAAWDLIIAMDKAKKKAGRLAKDTAAACDVYTKIAKDYHERVGLKVLKNTQDDLAMKKILAEMDAIRKDGKKIAASCKTDITKIEEFCRSAIEMQSRAKDAIAGKGRIPLDKLGPLHKQIDTARNKHMRNVEKTLYPMLNRVGEIEVQAKKLNSTKNEKTIAQFGKEMSYLDDVKQDFLNANGECVDELGEALNIIKQTQVTLADVKRMLEQANTILYDNPGLSLPDFPDICKDAKKNYIDPIMARKLDAIDDRDQKLLRDQLYNLKVDVASQKDLIKRFMQTEKTFKRRLAKHMMHTDVKALFSKIPGHLKTAASALSGYLKEAQTAEDHALKILELEPTS